MRNDFHHVHATPTQNCADYALRNDLGATVIEGDCASNQFSPESFGLYYVTGNCVIDGQTVGSRNAPVIIVVHWTDTQFQRLAGTGMSEQTHPLIR